MDGNDVVKCENRGVGYLSWGDPPRCYDDQSKACVGGNKVLKVKGKKLLCGECDVDYSNLISEF